MRPVLLAASLLMTSAAAAELIDRIAVSVKNSVITESEITRQIRITALLNNVEPKFNSDTRRETAERLVEQMLIRREMVISRYPAGDNAASAVAYQAFREHRGTEAEYKQTLERFHLTDPEVRDAFDWQTTFLQFLELHFRPAVRVSDQEIREYFDRKIKPKDTSISLDDARPQIEEILTQERIDNALDRWLGQVRTQARIVYREEVFK